MHKVTWKDWLLPALIMFVVSIGATGVGIYFLKEI